MIAVWIAVAFCAVCLGFIGFHLPTIRQARMGQLGRAIATAVESRSPFMEGMYVEISELTEMIALDIGVQKKDVQTTKVAALLCDIGLCSVPSAILQKTEEWTPEEESLFERHTEIGAAILKQSPILRKYTNIVQHHHAKFELEPRTPVASRIISVASDYVRFKRVYGASRALTVLERQSGIQYDPKVVTSLKELVSLQ